MTAPELTVELRAVREQLANLRDKLTDLKAARQRDDASIQSLQKENSELLKDVGILRQRLDDHLKRVDVWDSRKWVLVAAVVLAVFGAVLAFASGVIIQTVARKP